MRNIELYRVVLFRIACDALFKCIGILRRSHADVDRKLEARGM